MHRPSDVLVNFPETRASIPIEQFWNKLIRNTRIDVARCSGRDSQTIGKTQSWVASVGLATTRLGKGMQI